VKNLQNEWNEYLNAQNETLKQTEEPKIDEVVADEKEISGLDQQNITQEPS